ncbi:hypothetical protein HDU76_008148 [Blyttiomyces sp. JEL0837]|nr:hypothetical protein HDU76_008148 [Blyttiomyces sp. JEL0837]
MAATMGNLIPQPTPMPTTTTTTTTVNPGGEPDMDNLPIALAESLRSGAPDWFRLLEAADRIADGTVDVERFFAAAAAAAIVTGGGGGGTSAMTGSNAWWSLEDSGVGVNGDTNTPGSTSSNNNANGGGSGSNSGVGGLFEFRSRERRQVSRVLDSVEAEIRGLRNEIAYLSEVDLFSRPRERMIFSSRSRTDNARDDQQRQALLEVAGTRLRELTVEESNLRERLLNIDKRYRQLDHVRCRLEEIGDRVFRGAVREFPVEDGLKRHLEGLKERAGVLAGISSTINNAKSQISLSLSKLSEAIYLLDDSERSVGSSSSAAIAGLGGTNGSVVMDQIRLLVGNAAGESGCFAKAVEILRKLPTVVEGGERILGRGVAQRVLEIVGSTATTLITKPRIQDLIRQFRSVEVALRNDETMLTRVSKTIAQSLRTGSGAIISERCRILLGVLAYRDRERLARADGSTVGVGGGGAMRNRGRRHRDYMYQYGNAGNLHHHYSLERVRSSPRSIAAVGSENGGEACRGCGGIRGMFVGSEGSRFCVCESVGAGGAGGGEGSENGDETEDGRDDSERFNAFGGNGGRRWVTLGRLGSGSRNSLRNDDDDEDEEDGVALGMRLEARYGNGGGGNGRDISSFGFGGRRFAADEISITPSEDSDMPPSYASVIGDLSSASLSPLVASPAYVPW